MISVREENDNRSSSDNVFLFLSRMAECEGLNEICRKRLDWKDINLYERPHYCEETVSVSAVCCKEAGYRVVLSV